MPTKKPTPKNTATSKKEKDAVKPAKTSKKATEKHDTKVSAKVTASSQKAAAIENNGKAAKPSSAATLKKEASKKTAKPAAKKTTKAEAPVKIAKTSKAEKPSKVESLAKKGKVNGKVAAKSKEPVQNGSKSSKGKPEPVKEIKIPKTSVKTSVPYVPGYTPMEKRNESERPNEPLVRYSDNDLTEFRNLINKKLESAKKELAYLQGLITRKDDMGGDEADNRYMTMEDGSMSMEREQLSQMASRQLTFIDHLEKSLIRIENKTYGICRVTGKLIEKPRLLAVPHATLSLEAKLGLVKPNE